MLTLSFGGKNVKAFFFLFFFFFEKNFLSQIFQPVLCMHVNSVVHQIEKTLKKLKFLRRQIFYEFLKIAISKNVKTDFENRAKRQARTKACAILDMYHKAILPYGACSVHFATANAHPYCTLPVLMQTIKNFNNTVFMGNLSFPKMLSKAFIDDSIELKTL